MFVYLEPHGVIGASKFQVRRCSFFTVCFLMRFEISVGPCAAWDLCRVRVALCMAPATRELCFWGLKVFESWSLMAPSIARIPILGLKV